MTNAAALAYRFRLEYHITQLPLELSDLKKIKIKEKEIRIRYFIDAYDELSRNNLLPYTKKYPGFTYLDSYGVYHIYLNSDPNIGIIERRKILAHEIGHIVCDHKSNIGIMGMSNNAEDRDRMEIEANDFALALLAPMCVLKQLRIRTVGGVQNQAVISIPDAQRILGIISDQQNIGKTSIEKKLCNLILSNRSRKPSVKQIAITMSSVLLIVAIIFGTTLFLALKSAVQMPTDAPIPTSSAYKNGQLVAITPGGSKYHDPNCNYAQRNNVTYVTKEEAERMGKTPCLQCNP